MWADSRICPVAASADRPLTATSSRWVVVRALATALAKRHPPAPRGRASAGGKRALWDGVSFVSTRLAPSDLVGHGEGVDRPRCADLGRLGVAVARARCDGLGRRHPGVRFRGACGGCLVFRQGPSTSR
jgi:hypothetical protein